MTGGLVAACHVTLTARYPGVTPAIGIDQYIAELRVAATAPSPGNFPGPKRTVGTLVSILIFLMIAGTTVVHVVQGMAVLRFRLFGSGCRNVCGHPCQWNGSDT